MSSAVAANEVDEERTSRRLWGEAIGSFVLSFFFGSAFLYNIGASVSPTEVILMPTFILAIIVAIGAWIVYWLGSKMAKQHLQLNPNISVVHCAMKARYNILKNPQREGSYIGAALLELLFNILMQFIGKGLTALTLFLFGGLTLSDVHNRIYRDSNPASNVPTGTQLARAIVGAIIGWFGLVLLAFYVKKMTSYYGNKTANYSAYGKILAFFYFLYYILFWLFVKLSVDWLLGGIFCLFALNNNSNDRCSPLSSGTADGSLYLLIMGIEMFLSVVAFLIIVYWPDRVKKV